MKSNIIAKFANEFCERMAFDWTEKIQKLHTLLSDARRIGIAVHTHPDGDALGCAAAFCSFLKESLGKNCRIVLPDSAPDTLEFILEGLDPICASADPSAAAEFLSGCDLVACLDMNAFNRAGSLETMLKQSKAAKILVDHHQNPDTDSFSLVFSEIEISSASELMYRILLSLAGSGSAALLPATCREALMLGMTTDTNNFANSVFPSTLRMASDLLENGVDRDALLMKIYNRYPEGRMRAMGYILHEKMIITPEGSAVIVLNKDEFKRYGLRDGDTEGFVNLPLSIDNVKLSVFLKEDNGYFRVSLRSKKGTSAATLAKTHFHGGGHELASGGRLYFPEDIPDASCAEQYAVKVTARFLQES